MSFRGANRGHLVVECVHHGRMMDALWGRALIVASRRGRERRGRRGRSALNRQRDFEACPATVWLVSRQACTDDQSITTSPGRCGSSQRIARISVSEVGPAAGPHRLGGREGGGGALCMISCHPPPRAGAPLALNTSKAGRPWPAQDHPPLHLTLAQRPVGHMTGRTFPTVPENPAQTALCAGEPRVRACAPPAPPPTHCCLSRLEHVPSLTTNLLVHPARCSQ